MKCGSVLNIDLAPSLARAFSVDRYLLADIDHLFVCLWLREDDRKAYVPIGETPHYAFVRQVLLGESIWPARGYDSYSQYIRLHPHPCTEERFIELIESFRTSGYDAEARPILVFRSWRRPYPLTRWTVADGFHRLAILAAMGERCIPVATLKPKKDILSRFLERALHEL